MELKQGYLIVFEGIDGTGKSTHCQLMEEFLRGQGLDTVRFYEPTHGPWGQKIRKILKEGRGEVSPEEELSWFLNDRKEDVENNILPALQANKIVLLDRYYFSTAAYQGALGLDPKKIIRDNEAFAPRPDRVFLFTAPPETCLKRVDTRGEASSFERADYLQAVQGLFDSFDDRAIVRVDTRPPREEVHARLREAVLQLLGKE